MKWVRRIFMLGGLLATMLVDLSVSAWPRFGFTIFFCFITFTVISLSTVFSSAIYSALVQGVLLDLFSPSPFGIYMVSLVVLVCCVQVLRYNWLKQPTPLHHLITSAMGMSLAMIVFFSVHKLFFYFEWIDRDITNQVKFSALAIGFIIANFSVVIITRYMHRYGRPV